VRKHDTLRITLNAATEIVTWVGY